MDFAQSGPVFNKINWTPLGLYLKFIKNPAEPSEPGGLQVLHIVNNF